MREVRLGALRLDPADVVLRVRARNRLAADQQHRRVVDEADRLEGRLRVVAQVVEQARRRQQRDVVDQNRGAVGRRTRDAVVGDRAAAADHVLDEDGPAERARHLLADEARHRIGAAAGRVRDHERHVLGDRLRPGLRRQCGKQKANTRQRAPAIDHVNLPDHFLFGATAIAAGIRMQGNVAVDAGRARASLGKHREECMRDLDRRSALIGSAA